MEWKWGQSQETMTTTTTTDTTTHLKEKEKRKKKKKEERMIKMVVLWMIGFGDGLEWIGLRMNAADKLLPHTVIRKMVMMTMRPLTL